MSSVVKVWGEPERRQPYPYDLYNRSLNVVFKYHNDKELPPLEECVPSKGRMVDLGCGDGTFAAQFKERRPDVRVIAAGAHPLNPKNIEKIDRVFLGWIPQQRRLLEEFGKRIKLVVETYGPATYYPIPTHIINYAWSLLDSQGTYSCFSFSESLRDSGPPHTILGSPEHFVRIKRFYEIQLGSSLSYFGAVINPRNGSKEHYDCLLRVCLKRRNYVGKNPDFETLCTRVDEEIGIPKIVEREYSSLDGNYLGSIKVWPKDEEEKNSKT